MPTSTMCVECGQNQQLATREGYLFVSHVDPARGTLCRNEEGDFVAAYALDRIPLDRTLRPGVTVCIACHPARMSNGLLARALASVITQTRQPEAILVLNDVGREGVGWVRRNLLDQVQTEWIAWIDSDDEWDPGHLEKLTRVAAETDSVYVFSWMHGTDPLGHFGLPFNPCTPHHTTMNVLVRTDIAREVGFNDNQVGPHANEDWGFITGVAKLACERGLRMTHLAERTWTYHSGHGNSSGQPGQGDAA